MKEQDLKNLTGEVLEHLTVTFTDISVEAKEEGAYRINITTDESGLLIGTHGAHFSALSHVVRRIVAKKFGEEQKVTVDVNGYQEKAVDELKKQILILIERARSLRADVEMQPMSSYERMLVHSLSKDHADIKTESTGEGRERRVVIKYIGM